MWLLYYIIFWLHLGSVDDTRVYIFIYKYVQTGVIYWAEKGPECNVMRIIIYFYFYFYLFIYFLFSWLNGSVNGLNLEYNTTTIILSQKYKTAFSLKTNGCKNMIFAWLSPATTQLLEKLYFEFLHFLNFPCTWNKKARIINKIFEQSEIVHYGKSSISVFQEIFTSNDKIFFLEGRLSTRR